MHPVLIAQDYVKQHSQLINELQKENIQYQICKNTEIDISVALVSSEPDIIIVNASKLGHDTMSRICSEHGYKIRPNSIINIYTYEDPEELSFLHSIGIKQSIHFPYEPSLIVKHIRELQSVVPKNAQELMKRISEKLDAVMLEINPSWRQRGSIYIKEAVLILLFEPQFKVNLHADVYKRIAEKYSTSVKSVEHSIRISIDTCWEKTDKILLQELTGYPATDCKRPTNYAFIASLALKIRLDNKAFFDLFSNEIMNKTSLGLHI